MPPNGVIIPIHRRPQQFLTQLKARWAARTTADADADLLSVELLADLTLGVVIEEVMEEARRCMHCDRNQTAVAAGEETDIGHAEAV